MTEQTTACVVEGCERPAVDEAFGCAEHVALYDATAKLEAWEMAHAVLEPWYAATQPIAFEKLTEAMDKAMDHADERLAAAKAEVERLRLKCAIV